MNFPESFHSLRRLPCLDGWRCISILLVLLNHSRQLPGYDSSWDAFVRWLPDGRFGVEVFFVISGFLITFLLLKEKEKTGSVSLKMFYIRRALRILPAYFAFLIVLLGLCYFTMLKISPSCWISLLTFTANFFTSPWICLHLWSLSVEEQFYLLWPLITYLFLGGKKSFKKLMLALMIAIVLAPIFRIYGYMHPESLLFYKNSFFLYWDSLAIGCTLALLIGYWGSQIETVVGKKPHLFILLGLTLIIIPLIATRLLILGFFTVPLTVTFNAIGVALLILVSLIRPDLACFRCLEWKPVAAVGVISYSLYLWQQLFCTSAKDYGLISTPWFLSFPFWIMASFCAAVISYNFIEKPFISLKSRIQSKA